LVGLVLGEGLALAAMGIGLGLGGAVLATRAVSALLFNVSRLDPGTHIGAVGLLLVVTAAACGVPAWRALRVDAAEVLRD
jgi:ABC-type antimicrobial peptide transport system permease subunit